MNVPRMFVEYKTIPWMNINIQIVKILSEIDVFNSQTQSLVEIDTARDNFKNILDYFYFESLSVVIIKFPSLVHNMLNE